MNFVKYRDLFGVESKEIPSVVGRDAPTNATEGAVGSLYMDELTGDLYKCTVVSNHVCTWVKVGEKGEQGIQGIQGEKGETGPKGDKGDKGDQGDTGAQGIQGIQGEPGQTGEKGDKGDPGEPGAKGETGPKGDQGEQGIQGPKGDKGDKGDPGEKGEQGIPGIQGPKGDQGPAGADGAKGDKGDKGDTGAAGSNGKDGTSVTVKSVSESTADGGSNVVTFSDGKTVTIKNGSKGSKGEKGDTGEKGEQGPKGDTGAAGKDGADGLPGAPGAYGKDGYTPVRGVDYWTTADKAEIEAYIATELAKRGQLKPEFAESLAWLKANGDTTKLYILPDGYIYACTPKTTAGEKIPNFKNVLETATISLNQRFNSSDTLKDATGYIAIDHIPVKSGDVVRINDTAVISASAGSNRVKYYNSSKSAITTYTGSDARADQILKITTANGVISWVVGYYNTTLGNNSTNTLPSAAANIAYMRANLYISSATITEADIADLILTINEEISYTTTAGGTEYVWESTGHAFVPADYEDRIIELETEVETLKAENEALANRIENKADSALSIAEVFAPSPQLPADGSATADFNAETITAKQIYDYLDALVAKYPKYVTKETLGKDESGEFDWNRYTLCRRYYDAWQKVNYPKMYGWTNGSTTIYSVSVSPRIGDTLYTTQYIGTAKGTVTAVSNANQTRTVGGVAYTRDKTKDVEPTLVYTETYYSPYYVGAYAGFKNKVYDANKSAMSTIATYSASAMTDASGNSYVRYPLGDRDNAFKKPQAIVIGANEHGRDGDPAEPAIVSARMMKDLCECVNANNPFLNLLKNNYMVVFCPIINPWGFDNSHKNYLNSNSVNIDRNFDTVGWGNDTSSGGQGEYGGSENETQYFMNTIVASGAKIVTANHGLGTQINTTTGEAANAGHCHWMLGRNNTKYSSSLLAIGETMSANYNLAFTDYGEAPPESHAKTRSYIASVGAEGGAVEMQAREGFIKAGEGTPHTARILEADYTLLLQFLYMLLKNAQ